MRLILDALGSHAFTSSKQMLADLAAAGVEVMLHDLIPPDRHGPIGQRRAMPHAWQAGRVEHRKLVLVDGRVAYIGGAGIEDHFANGKFHDVYIRVTGPITRQLQALFVTTFRYHGGTIEADDPSLQDDASTLEPGSHNVTLHMNWPRGWLPLTDAATELIESATQRLEITNPYIGDPGLIHAIAAAARRGARVRLLVSDDAHGGIAYAAFQHHYDELLGAGVEIFEYPALVHAKVIVSDDRALVGTLNLDAWAMFRNPEHGLLFDDKTVADRVLIDPRRARHRRIDWGEPTRTRSCAPAMASSRRQATCSERGGPRAAAGCRPRRERGSRRASPGMCSDRVGHPARRLGEVLATPAHRDRPQRSPMDRDRHRRTQQADRVRGAFGIEMAGAEPRAQPHTGRSARSRPARPMSDMPG